MSFKLDGQRKWQEVESSLFQIEPAQTLRTIVLVYPNVTNKLSVNKNPFSAQISVLNIGYSTIRSLQLINIRPDITNAKGSGPVEFALDSVDIDSKQYANKLNIWLSDLESGKVRQISLNFSTTEQVP